MARVKWCMQDLVVVLPDICGGYGIGRNSRIAVLSAPGSSDSEPDCHFHPKARALSIAGTTSVIATRVRQAKCYERIPDAQQCAAYRRTRSPSEADFAMDGTVAIAAAAELPTPRRNRRLAIPFIRISSNRGSRRATH